MQFGDLSPKSTRSVCFTIAADHKWFDVIDTHYMHLVSREDPKLRVVLVPLGKTGWKLSMANVTPEQEANMDVLLAEVICGVIPSLYLFHHNAHVIVLSFSPITL